MRSEVYSLDERHIPIIPLVIYSFIKSLPRTAPVVFDFLVENDEAPIVGAKRRYEDMELGDPKVDFSRT